MPTWTQRLSARRLQAVGWAVAALLIVVAAVIAAELAGWPFLAGPAQRALTRQLGVPVQIETPFRLHLLGTPRLQVGRLHVDSAAPGVAPFLADAQRVELRWRWGDLWRYRRGDTLRVAALEADRLEAHLRRDAEGAASWQLRPMQAATPASEPASDPPPPAAGGATPAPLPRFDLLRVGDSVVHVDDAPLQLRLEVRAQLQGAGESATPGLIASAQGSFRGAPASGRLEASAPIELAADRSRATHPLKIVIAVGATQLDFDGQVADLWGERLFDGALRMSGPSLAAVGKPLGITLPTTPPFALRGQLARTVGVWHLKTDDARIGSSRLAGAFDYDTRPRVPLLRGALHGPRLVFADLGPAIGAPAAASAPAAARGQLLPQRSFDLPSLQRMDANVAIALDELDLGTQQLEALRPVRAHLTLKDGVLDLTDIEAKTAGGTFSGNTRLDSRGGDAAWGADVRWRDIDLAGWVKGVRTAPVDAHSPARLKRERKEARQATAPARAYVTGELRGAAQLTGRGKSTAQILSTLDGTLRTTVRDGTVSHLAIELAGVDLAESLGLVLRGDHTLPLNCAIVAMRAKGGVLTTEAAVVDTPDSTLTAKGQVDLRSERLDLEAVVHPKDFTPFSLRSPLEVQGPFAAPRVQIKRGPVAARLAAAAALATVNPLAAIAPFLDPGDRGDAGCTPTAERKANETSRAAAVSAASAPRPK